MNNEVYQKIVNEYNTKKREKKCYNDLLKLKEELESNEIVKEYLFIIEQLKKYDDSINKSDDEMILDAYNKCSHRLDDDNEIFVYIGTYKYAVNVNFKGTIDKSVDRNDPEADYRLYINLENFMRTKEISIEEADEFEKTHKIVYSKGRHEYKQIQNQYIIDSVRYGQEKAIQKILKK